MDKQIIYTAGICIGEDTWSMSCAYGIFYSTGNRYNKGYRTGDYNCGKLYAALEGIYHVLKNINVRADSIRKDVPVVIKTNVTEAAYYAINPKMAPSECIKLAKCISILCTQCSVPVSIEAYGVEDMMMGGQEAVAQALLTAERM